MTHARMTFGRHKGELISEVDPAYLAWVLAKCTDAPPWLLDAIREHLGAHQRSKAPPPPPPRDSPPWTPPPPPPPSGAISKADLDAAIKGWYRDLARRWHPDLRRGSNEGMIAVNDANEKLRQALAL